MPPKAKKRKRRVVVDTSVLVAGISGFKETYLTGKNPSADVLHEWAEEHNFIWLISEDMTGTVVSIEGKLGKAVKK